MELGFTFKIIPNSNFYLATLPEGWRSVAGEEDYWINLIDEKGRKRGRYVYEPNCNNFMDLSRRFYISREADPNVNVNRSGYIYIRDRANNRVIYSPGVYDVADSVKELSLIAQANTFLSDNYPDWENPMKYWDLEESAIQYA